jgi:ricin-type beta-trefoil lectin protein
MVAAALCTGADRREGLNMVTRKLVRRLVIAVGTISVLAAGAFVPASAATSSEVLNGKSGKCLSVDDGSLADGALVIQWTCNGGPEQQWTFANNDTWLNVRSGKCLSVEGGGSVAVGAHVIQWTCNGGPEQQWTPVTNGDAPFFLLVNDKSGLVLSVSGGGSTANGAEILQWSQNGGPEQEWSS